MLNLFDIRKKNHNYFL